jgi:hypothetical protein
MKPEVNIKRTVKLIPTVFDELEDGEPGKAAIFHENVLHFTCPGCGRFGGIGICYGANVPNAWLLVEGNKNDPTTWTLSPSIRCVGCCGWHGYLTKGVFTSC